MSPFAILGQDKAINLLVRARKHNRLAHAYLFTGPEGCGKATLARAFAAALLCHERSRFFPEIKACGACPSCQRMLSGNHPDFLLIEPEGQGIKIEAIRTMKAALTLAPLEGQIRCVLLRKAHTMRQEAANCLLKILEEPPPGNILLLTADSGAGMLATIRSRCQHIGLQSLPLPLAAQVISACKKDTSPASCQTLAALSSGCPGQALRLDEDVALLYGELVNALNENNAPPAAHIQRALRQAGRLQEHKDEAPLIFSLLRQRLKEALAARLCGRRGAKSAHINGQDAHEELSRIREGWSEEQLFAKLGAIDQAEARLKGNCTPSLVFEVLLLELSGCFQA